MNPILQALQSLMQPKQQQIISPLPKSESPGGINSPLQPGLNAYYQREGAANQITPQQAMQTLQQQKPQPIQIPQSLANAPKANFSDFTTAKVPQQFQDLIYNSAIGNGVDPNVFASLLFTEHGFQTNDKRNYNSDGSYDRGIAQINTKAHPEITDQQALDPQFAIPWAARELGTHIKSMKDINKGIASYNVGQGGASDPKVYSHAGQVYIDKVARGLSPSLVKKLGIKPSFQI